MTDYQDDQQTQDDHHLILRAIEARDYPEIEALMNRVYKDLGGAWPRQKIMDLIDSFPDGQICIEDNGKVVAAALTVQVSYDRFSNPHTYDELITDQETLHHSDEGDCLYGLDVFVDPDYRGFRLGRRLYEARKELCRALNLKAILAGGRIPNYYEYCEEVTALEYIQSVKRKEIYDPILSFQLSNDFTVKRLLRRYLPEDEKSQGYATLLEWNNILFEPITDSVFETRKTTVRVGAIQWQMRKTRSLEELFEQIDFFVSSLSDYQADFAVFPEFFNAPLMGLGSQESPVEAIRTLAQYTEQIVEFMQRLAVTYNINIIGGSMPLMENDKCYNIAYLFRRDGTRETQYKLHITPHERKDWVMNGGRDLQVFETDAGRIGILICYDVEFPELGRLLCDDGMEILFVPFWTDTKNGYLRVRHCAQARAIENECYVAISGSVGNLPRVDNVNVQYAQSAVFSPSDFPFPHDAIMAETTPNTEMVMFVDLDLDKLKMLRNEGSVTNYKDRRRDLYEINWKPNQ